MKKTKSLYHGHRFPAVVISCAVRRYFRFSRRRERQMCGFRDARRTQAFLSCFVPIRQHFALPRHQMNAACHRAVLKERFATLHGLTITGAVEKII